MLLATSVTVASLAKDPSDYGGGVRASVASTDRRLPTAVNATRLGRSSQPILVSHLNFRQTNEYECHLNACFMLDRGCRACPNGGRAVGAGIAGHRRPSDGFLHDLPQFRNHLLREPGMLSHPACTAPTRMRQRKELRTIFRKCP